jgi:hypothetical protein
VIFLNMKKGLISLLIVVILSLCAFNNVAAAPVSKLTPDIHGTYARDLKGKQQTYLLATLNGDRTTVTIGVGQDVSLDGVLSYSRPPTSWLDTSHGIPNGTVNIQSMDFGGKTWTTVYIGRTLNNPGFLPGSFAVKLTPMAAGVYTYRVIYDGNSYYAPAVSNVVTLTVSNMVVS